MEAASSGPAPALHVFRRLLGFARPYLPLVIAIGLCTLLFSVGRYGRAYLMKPLLDGVLLPVAEGAAPVGSDAAAPDGWLGSAIERLLPDALAKAPAQAASGGTAPAAAHSLSGIRTAFRELLLLALLIVVVTPLALFGRTYLSEWVLGRVDVDIKQRIAAKLLALPLARHQREKSGDLLSRTQNDARAARDALKLVFEEFLVSLSMIAIGLATLLYISWPLTAIALLAAPAIVGVLGLFGARIRRSASHRQQQLGEVTQRLVGILSGIKVIKAFGGEAVEGRAFARETRKLFRHDMRVVRDRVFARALVETLNSGAGFAMLAIGAVLVLQGRFGLSTGDVAAFATVLATTYKPIKNLSKGWGRLMEQLASGERFFALLDLPDEPADAPGAIALCGHRHCVRFENVGVCHRDDRGHQQRVLDGVSLEVPAGEVLAVVGRTGEGKTTLMDLLLRFHDPSSGRITLDGHDLRLITRESLRRQVAVVTQEPFLFDTTIGENIRYGRPDASREQLLLAARAAHVDEFVDHLPLGYETQVGEFGVRLSGGQRQRITIARALLMRPAILIFDEATSALDAKTERSVHDAIDAMRGESTILLVAHRLSTIRRADRIVVLAHGRIHEQGSHAELMARGGLYRELVSYERGPGSGEA